VRPKTSRERILPARFPGELRDRLRGRRDREGCRWPAGNPGNDAGRRWVRPAEAPLGFNVIAFINELAYPTGLIWRRSPLLPNSLGRAAKLVNNIRQVCYIRNFPGLCSRRKSASGCRGGLRVDDFGAGWQLFGDCLRLRKRPACADEQSLLTFGPLSESEERIAGLAVITLGSLSANVLASSRDSYFRGLPLTGCFADSACSAVAIGKNSDADLLAKRRNS
jgi:hypothetical protein